MGASYDLPDPAVFTAGAVGVPGRRVFHLQWRHDGRVVTLKCEKAQVAALADYLDELLADAPTRHHGLPDPALELTEPLEPEWVVGALGAAYDPDSDRVVLIAEELVPTDEDGEPDPNLDAEKGTLRCTIAPAQAAAFVERAKAIVAAGRPPCVFCGRPLDPDGHLCPRMN